MAPKPHIEDKSKNHKCGRVHFNVNRERPATSGCSKVTIPCKCDNQRGTVSNSSSIIKPPESYENLLLFYLTKLKNLFSSAHSRLPAKAVKTNKPVQHSHNLRSNPRGNFTGHPCNHSYSSTPSSAPRPTEEDIKSNVRRVVSAALEYGYANNILEKKGDYFILKNNRHRIANNRATPGPRYCEKCCNVHKFLSTKEADDLNRFSNRHKPMYPILEKPIYSVQQGRIEKSYRGAPSGRPFTRPNCEGGRFKANMIRCPNCRALERKRGRM